MQPPIVIILFKKWCNFVPKVSALPQRKTSKPSFSHHFWQFCFKKIRFFADHGGGLLTRDNPFPVPHQSQSFPAAKQYDRSGGKEGQKYITPLLHKHPDKSKAEAEAHRAVHSSGAREPQTKGKVQPACTTFGTAECNTSAWSKQTAFRKFKKNQVVKNEAEDKISLATVCRVSFKIRGRGFSNKRDLPPPNAIEKQGLAHKAG